jgi:hypothetical protein
MVPGAHDIRFGLPQTSHMIARILFALGGGRSRKFAGQNQTQSSH